jgi:hypothetical protein
MEVTAIILREQENGITGNQLEPEQIRKCRGHTAGVSGPASQTEAKLLSKSAGDRTQTVNIICNPSCHPEVEKAIGAKPILSWQRGMMPNPTLRQNDGNASSSLSCPGMEMTL